MNCKQNSGYPPRRPMGPGPMAYHGSMPCQQESYQRPTLNPGPGANMCGPAIPGPNQMAGMDRFPVGMGYVPMQNWETPFPMERGFHRGTIFPSLDYPFVMGGCRR